MKNTPEIARASEMACTCLFSACLIVWGGCSSSPGSSTLPSEAPTEKVVARTASIEQIIDAGAERPFGPAGPRFELEADLYAKVAAKPDQAISILEKRLEAENAIIRCNAYDFLAHLRRNQRVGEKARALLDGGRRDESSSIREFVKLQLSKPEP